MPTITGSAGNAVPHTKHVPIPTTPRGTTPRPRVSTSPFAGKPVVEFTREQLARAGYRLAGTGDGESKPKHRRAPGTVNADRIVTMYRDEQRGVTEIQRATGYDRKTIRRHLAAAGIESRHKPNRRPWTELGEAAERLYTDEALSMRQVGERLGLSHPTVGRLLEARGVEFRDENDVDVRAVRLLLNGNGVAVSQVRAWAQRQGRDCPPFGIPPRVLVEDYLLARTPRRTA